MKCLVLAGGSGDRLWPLSRKNHPKQFMDIRKGRSMFQESILRNIPFCDEFIILTNKRYESIIKGQLQDFQDLKYSVLMEESPLKTAPSIVTLALNSDGDEEFLIVSTDNVMDGEYNACITQLKEEVKKNKIAVVGCLPKERPTGNHYFEIKDGKVRYSTVWGRNAYLDCGVMGCKVSVLLKYVDPVFLAQCKTVNISNNVFVERKQEFLSHKSLAEVLSTDAFVLIKSKLSCLRITDISSYYKIISGEENGLGKIIENNCKNVHIINAASDRIVVANDVKDVLVANTKDAVYITKIDSKKCVKEIANEYYESNRNFFDDYPVTYQDWGVSEVLSFSSDYKVSKITLYSKNTIEGVADKGVHVNFFLTEGVAGVSSKDEPAKLYKANETVSFKSGENYKIVNETKKSITLVKIENKKSVNRSNNDNREENCFVKLKPALKDFIWGGTKIRDVLGKNIGKFKTVAESWELSAHTAGQSKIATGAYKGYNLSNYIEETGRQNLGWKAQDYERFPILIKFIDARENLSIQVHPDDEYAFPHEGEYGKNEMWYIMSADKDAYIYMGFNKNVTKEEIRQRIKDNTLVSILNKIPVKKGETYFLKAGTVHAIGAGCLICEIQQSSNVTYRLYDYNRIGYTGKPRELHIEKALEVANMQKSSDSYRSQYGVLEFSGYKKQLLGQCKYFTATKYTVKNELTIVPNGASFKAVIVIEGAGKIGNDRTTSNTVTGDTWFCGCKEVIVVKGNLTIIVASI